MPGITSKNGEISAQGEKVEQFTIDFNNQGNATNMQCMFGTTRFAIPFNPENN
jgi:hypothetical protein